MPRKSGIGNQPDDDQIIEYSDKPWIIQIMGNDDPKEGKSVGYSLLFLVIKPDFS